MLEITRKTLTLESQEVMELERIVTDEDPAEAFIFFKEKNLPEALYFPGKSAEIAP